MRACARLRRCSLFSRAGDFDNREENNIRKKGGGVAVRRKPRECIIARRVNKEEEEGEKYIIIQRSSVRNSPSLPRVRYKGIRLLPNNADEEVAWDERGACSDIRTHLVELLLYAGGGCAYNRKVSEVSPDFAREIDFWFWRGASIF